VSRTLLVGSHTSSWREWVRDRARGRDVLILDPADGSHGPPCRFVLLREGKAVEWAFAGAIDPTRDPIRTLAEASRLLGHCRAEVVVQLYGYRATPVGRHLNLAIAQIVKPDEILVADGTPLDLRGWPVGPQTIATEVGFPDLVQQAQRRARWIELLDRSVEHAIDLRQIAIQGARLGSGISVHLSELEPVLHAEVAGGSILLVAPRDIGEGEISQAISFGHASRAHIVEPEAYAGLLVSFARQDGEDFALGILESIDFVSGIVRVKSPAVAPAPVRILKFGGLRLDRSGKELGEVKPWAV